MVRMFNFGNGIIVDEAKINVISNAVIENIKKELPEEAQCIEVIESVLEEVKSNIRRKRLQL